MLLTISLTFAWVCIAGLADVLFKNASGFSDIKFVCGLILYATTAILAVLTFKRIEFGSLIILWITLSLLVGLMISVFYYHEKFTLTTAIAAFLTVIVIVLIGRNNAG